MLRLTNIARQTEGGQILAEISMEVGAGEIVSILGPTASGKTSLLRLIMGLDTADSGEIRWGEVLLAEGGRNVVPAHRRDFSLVFQETALLPFLNVERNIRLGAQACAEGAEARLAEVVSLLRLGDLLPRPAARLSGGEQQRVAVARSLMTRPRLLLLDEPFSNLDRPFREELFPAFKAHLEAAGMAAVFVTHDREEAFFFSQRIFLLRAGRLLRAASPLALYRGPADEWEARILGDLNLLTCEQARAVFGYEPNSAATRAVLIRPEQIELVPHPPDHGTLRTGTLQTVAFHGFYQTLGLAPPSGPVIEIKALSDTVYEPGTAYGLRLKAATTVTELI